jgi:hypothetical protein
MRRVFAEFETKWIWRRLVSKNGVHGELNGMNLLRILAQFSLS